MIKPEVSMVKGDWIIFLKEMRCKNWVNGVEVRFYFNENCQIEGKIEYIPPGLREGIPFSPNQVIFLFRMRRQATLVFMKACRKKRPESECQGSRVQPVPELPRETRAPQDFILRNVL
jgi:hypothetical protein